MSLYQTLTKRVRNSFPEQKWNGQVFMTTVKLETKYDSAFRLEHSQGLVTQDKDLSSLGLRVPVAILLCALSLQPHMP